MKKKILVFVLIVLLDMLSTYFASPNLKGEQNFIVKIYNAGWFGLLVFQFFRVLFYIWIYKKSDIKITSFTTKLLYFVGNFFIHTAIIIGVYVLLTNFVIGFYVRKMFNPQINQILKNIILFEQDNNLVFLIKIITYISVSIYFFLKLKSKTNEYI